MLKQNQNNPSEQQPQLNDRWMSVEDLCEYLPFKPTKGWVYVKTYKGSKDKIPFRKCGKRLLFLQSEVDHWLMCK